MAKISLINTFKISACKWGQLIKYERIKKSFLVFGYRFLWNSESRIEMAKMNVETSLKVRSLDLILREVESNSRILNRIA